MWDQLPNQPSLCRSKVSWKFCKKRSQVYFPHFLEKSLLCTWLSRYFSIKMLKKYIKTDFQDISPLISARKMHQVCTNNVTFIITRWAGRFTPHANVLVQTNTCNWREKRICQNLYQRERWDLGIDSAWILLLAKSSSTRDRSLSFRPAWCKPTPNCKVCLKFWSVTWERTICKSASGMLRNWCECSSEAANFSLQKRIHQFNIVMAKECLILPTRCWISYLN